MRLVATGLAAAGAMLIAAQPAAAHEIGLVLVAARGDAVDGFRLAVDESPDVSHAPGPEAGDHLGGIDVEVSVVGPREGAALRAGVARAIASGARVVVVLARASVASDVVATVRSAGPLIVVAGAGRAVRDSPAAAVVLLGTGASGSVDRVRLDRFRRAFARRYRRSASDAALAGYDAGRLVDSLLGTLGEGPFPRSLSRSALTRAARRLVAGTASAARASVGDG